MKKLFYLILGLVILSSCSDLQNHQEYPKYKLYVKTIVHDSLKTEYRLWIQETVKVASYNMTGGDYEDVDETILQAERTADRIFGEDVECLRISLSEYNSINIPKYKLNNKQLIEFNKLRYHE